MAHARKPDFVFRAKRTSPFKSAGASDQSTTGTRGVRVSGGNAGYNMFRGSVKGTGYPLHSPVSTSLPLPCVTVCHHISTGIYPPRSEDAKRVKKFWFGLRRLQVAAHTTAHWRSWWRHLKLRSSAVSTVTSRISHIWLTSQIICELLRPKNKHGNSGHFSPLQPVQTLHLMYLFNKYNKYSY